MVFIYVRERKKKIESQGKTSGDLQKVLNPFLDTNKTAIILSKTSQAAARAYKRSFKATETTKKNLFQQLDREYNEIREKTVTKAFELVA